jgi:hypothetical protein
MLVCSLATLSTEFAQACSPVQRTAQSRLPSSQNTWPHELMPLQVTSHSSALQRTALPQALTPEHSTRQLEPPHSISPMQLCSSQRIVHELASRQLTPALQEFDAQCTSQGMPAGQVKPAQG